MRPRIMFGCLAIMLSFALPTFAQLRYGPYIQNTAHDRATVIWYTPTITTGILRYGPAPGNWQNEITVAADSAHFVEVTGLAADRRYYYEVASPTTVYASGAEYYFDTHPEIGCTKPFTFAAFGDIGMLEQVQFDVAARLKTESHSRDFSVLLGDIVYSSGARVDYKPKYFDVYQDMLRHEAWWGCLGNHDIRDNGGLAYFEFFVTPANNPYNREHFYSFDYGSAHFVVIDNELHLEGAARTEQLNWIRADLQDAINRGQRWLIAFWHEAPYSGGTHSGDGFAKTNFIPIMDQFGVDLVLSGHSHVLERTFPMVNHGVINTHPNQYTKNGHQPGTVYIVSGAGGEEEDLEIPGLAEMAFQRGATGGYAVITINQDTLSGHFMTKSGDKLDPYRIIKTGLPPAAKQPVLTSIGNLILAEGDTSTHLLNATIADQSSPTTMTLTGLPGFATFTDLGNGQGRLALAPNFYQSGVYNNIKLTVENSCAVSSKIFSITVHEVTDPPTLQAVGNHTMDEAATLALTLTAADPNNDALTFSVNPLPAFATLTPLTSNTAQLTFAPNYRQDGVYAFVISVTDGHAWATEHITLTVHDLNRAPRIDSLKAMPNPLGDDATAGLHLFASDADPGDVLSFSWNASAGTITGSGANVTFVPPLVADTSLVPIIVEANDGVGGAAFDTLFVQVYHVNRMPVARAGSDQFVTEGDTVRLSAAASSDFDSQPLQYLWRQLTGVAVAFSDSQSVQPFFIAPRPAGEANFAFALTVHDGESASAPDTMQVLINSKPVLPNGIVAARDTVYDDATLPLDANASDADNDALTWQWHTTLDTLVGNGANVTFHPPIVTAPTPVLLTVAISDGRGGLTRDSLAVLVLHANRTPIARAGAEQFVSEGDTVRLNAAASSDFESQPSQYLWRQLTGVNVALVDSQSARPYFIAPRPESEKVFRFELIVNDGIINSAPDTVAIAINTLPDLINGIIAAHDTIPDTTTLALHANASDADGDSLTLNWTTTHGSLTGTGANVLFAPPILQDTARVTITLNVQDGRGGVRNATREVVVFHVNRIPVAHAGADQNTSEGKVVNLNGHRSSDADEQTMSFHWRQLTGIPVTLQNAQTGHPKFVAPRPDSVANYLFELVVNDGMANSAPDTVKININALPLANAGAEQFVSEGASVALDGSASNDWEGQPLQYRWRQLTGVAVALSDSQAVAPSFVAPRPQNGVFNFQFALVVNDGRDASTPDTMSVLINALPLANAGAEQFVTEGDSVALNGSASSDLEGHALTFRWRQLSGTAITLSDSQAVQPFFFAPLPNGESNFAFELVVNDGIIDSKPDTVQVRINTKPVIANGIEAASDSLGDDATLALAAQATDADNDSLLFHWSASLGTITGNGANVLFTPPPVSAPEFALVTLAVSDGKGGSVRDSLRLRITHPNRLPVARAGADQFVTEGDSIVLDASASSDFENSALSYLWRQLNGEAIALSDSQVAQPFFIAPSSPQTKSFAFALMVHDGLDQSAPDTVVITINRAPLILGGIHASRDSVGDDATLALNANVSDADGDSLAYVWSTNFGTLAGAGANVTFTPPLVTHDSTARIALQVSDGNGGMANAQRDVLVYHVNRLPVAVAGAEQFVTEGDSVFLDASASHDFENSALAYLWQQLNGETIVLSDSQAVQPFFIAPSSHLTKSFAFTLRVHDGLDYSAPDTVVITINRKPVLPSGITASRDTMADDMTLALSALATDADNDSLTYQWSATMGAVNGAGANVVFAPAFVTDTSLAKIFLLVHDGKGGSVRDSLRLVIYHGNDAPIARAGVDQFVTEGDTVRLSGAQSGDPEQQTLSFHWRQVHGEHVALSDSHTVAPFFIAPRATPDTMLRFVLIVNDGFDASGPDTVQINVNNLPRIASLVAAQDSIATEDTLAVQAAVANVDGDALTFHWTTTSGSISNNGANALFLPPQTKTPLMARLKLRVVDEHGGETQDSLAIKVYHRNQAPRANAGANQSVTEGDLVTLDGRASSDADNDALTFAWRKIFGPTIVFMHADSARPSFYAPGVEAAARVEVELIVHDGATMSAPDTVSCLIAPLAGGAGEATFTVVADAAVRQGRPDKNYGAYPDLEMELDPQRRSYLKFKVTGVLGPIQSAKLKLRAKDDAPSGGTVHVVHDTLWSETAINYLNAPAYVAAPTAQFGALLENVDYEVDVTSGMNGNRAVSFVLVANNATPAAFLAREGGSAAQLWVKFGQSSNLAPKILSGPSATPSPVGDNASANVSVQALELDGEPLQYVWSTTLGTITGNGASVTFTPPNVNANASATISVQINDGKGGVVSGQTSLTVLPVNEAPRAHAGADQRVDYAQLVTLNGSASHDSEGAPLTFAWSQISGPGVALASANTVTPNFVAPTVADSAKLAFRLVVSDGVQQSAPDTVLVTVVDRSVTLSFTPSHDSYVNDAYPSTNYNADSSLVLASAPQRRIAYLRFDVTGIAGEVQAAALELTPRANSIRGGTLHIISNAAWSETSLLAKNAPSLDGPSLGSQARITKNVKVRFDVLSQVWGNGAFNFAMQADTLVRYYTREMTLPPRLVIKYVPVANFAAQRPLANAGADRNVGTETSATLSGAASSDPQGQALLYYWTQISGVTVALSDLHASAPTFIAPLAAQGTTLGFQLIVSDGKYASLPDTVLVSVAAPRQTMTLLPTADSYVDANSPKKNYGTTSSLSAQSSPVRRGYLRFNVTGISTQIESAILRVTSGATAPMGGAIHKISNNTWTEAGVKYSSAPVVDGPELSRLGSVVKSQVYEFNVKTAITGPGTYNFAYVSDNITLAKIASRESTTPPQLIITYLTSTNGLAKDEDEEEGLLAEENLPQAFELYPSYPNPFLVSVLAEPVTFKYALKEAGHVTLRVYNTLGQLVRTLVNEERNVGLHWMRWNGRDQHGQEVGTGVYIYRLEVAANNGERYVATRKLTRMK